MKPRFDFTTISHVPDAPPRKEKLSRFQESDRTGTLVLPPQIPLPALTKPLNME